MPDLTRGSYDWREIRQTVTAPEGAVRMALFLGVLPGVGRLGFDDIQIKTATASSPAAAVAQDALPPAPAAGADPRSVHHRPLGAGQSRARTTKPNDGKGGWSDQGPMADMRALKTGKVKFGGVPFEIGAEPRCAVVLKSATRNPGQLPARVTIPIGPQAGHAVLPAPPVPGPAGAVTSAFRYVLHYRDHKDVTLLVTGNNLSEWTTDPVRRFPKEDNTFSTAAVTVPVPKFGQGTVLPNGVERPGRSPNRGDRQHRVHRRR